MSIISHLLYNKSNERLRQFIEAIRTRDFSLQYSLDNLRGEERELALQINRVVNAFRETTLRQEAQSQYFGTMLDTINAYLIVADGNGTVHWMNKAAVDDLCGFAIHRLEDLVVLNGDLPELMRTLMPGEQKLVQLSVRTHGDQKGEGKTDVALSMVNFFHRGFSYQLYTLQNVQPVIQKNETDAQRQLVRVLTHEIMNSLTPIISLSDTICDGLQQGSLSQDDVLTALQAINRRSNGLLQFVENYRKLQHVSQPFYADVTVGNLVADLKSLFPEPAFQYDIENEEQVIRIDRAQMEQVLINLLKNAREATLSRAEAESKDADASIQLSTRLSGNKRNFIITVTDHGEGILPDVMERIFVPFFTTKQDGSGIGLSICKQIVTLHGGTITASSSVDTGTVFTIVLPVY